MNPVKRLTAVVLPLVVLLAGTSLVPAGGAKRSDSVVKTNARVEKKSGGQTVIVVQLDIQKGWHLYANPVGNDDLASSQTVVSVTGKAKPKAVKVEYPAGHVKQDKILGKYHVYEDKVEIRATVDHAESGAGPFEVGVKLAACDDKHCLPPANVKVTLP